MIAAYRAPWIIVACIAIAFLAMARTDAATGSVLLKGAKVEDKDKALFFGGCDSDPFPFLEQRHKGDKSNSFITQDASGQRGLDTALACRVMKLIQFAESKNCPVVITSAMRPVQRCKPGGGACARPGNSCHQFGRAVDLSGDARCLELITGVIGRKLSKANNEFRLHVAYVENGNYRHVQCIEHQGANFSDPNGCRSACDGGKSINPDFSKLPGPGATSPTGTLADTFRRALGMETQPPPQTQPSPQPQPAPQPQPSIPSQPGGVSPTQLFRDPPAPTPTPVGTPAPVVTPGTKTGSSTSFDTQPGRYDSSVADKLLDLAYGTPLDATSTAVATSVPLTIDGSDRGGVDTGSETGSSAVPLRSATTADPYALTPTNTFVSPELSGGPYEVVASYRGEPTGFIALLIQLRDAFAALLRILRPMGIREAIAPTSIDQEEVSFELEFDPQKDLDAAQETANDQGEKQLIVE